MLTQHPVLQRQFTFTRMIVLCLLLTLTSVSVFGQTPCGNVQVQLTPDYSFAIGSSSGGTGYTFTLNGQPLAQGALTQRALFHYDNALASASGVMPVQSVGTSLVPGKFGSALAIAPGGVLSYPVAGNLDFQTGTIEMWLAPRFDGTNAIYSRYNHSLILYALPNGNQFIIAKGSGGNFFAGTVINGRFTGANSRVITSWQAGDWHHLAFTYSAAEGRQRLYLDGELVNENKAVMPAPESGGSSFTVNSDPWGNASAFVVDELRISNEEKSPAAIEYDAKRSFAFADNEVLLPLTGVSHGQLSYAVSGCGSASYSWTGIPITNFTPPSTLLPPGSNSVTITFNTPQPTVCRYSVGTPLDYNAMRPFDTVPGTATHKGIASGLSSDTRVLNQVYIRCASNPDYLQTATYRTVAPPGQAYPRIGNIWWGGYVYGTKPDQAKKIQLYLGSNLSANQAIALRAVSPNVLILTSVNVFDIGDEVRIPDDYYMKDVRGNKIQTGCGFPRFLLNLTKPEVAKFLGRLGYELVLQSNLAFDGLFLDTYETLVSFYKSDCRGNPVQIDANGDGVADDPKTLDNAWKTGLHLVTSTYKDLMPYSYLSGHVGGYVIEDDPPTLTSLNGTSILWETVNVREGIVGFRNALDLYHTWQTQSAPPAMTMVQTYPPNQIAYGYGYFPLQALLPETINFAQNFYPNMRFGLSLSLMNDGFFTHDFGDTWSLINWWYDEFDFSLGYPLGPAIPVNFSQPVNLIRNSGFENSLMGTWQLQVKNDNQVRAIAALDSTTFAKGNLSAHVTVESVESIGANPWDVTLKQGGFPLGAGASYQMQFWARADKPLPVTVMVRDDTTNSKKVALTKQFAIGASWQLYSVSFSPLVTTDNGLLEFWMGNVVGNVWLDEVVLSAAPSVYRRDFTHGIALLNGSNNQQTISLGSGFKRFLGTQAPKYQYIVDDDNTSFSSSGAWNTVIYNTGSHIDFGSTLPAMPQNANGPYYHAWQGKVHQLDATSGTAQWNLNLTADGRYTIQVWLPAAPTANTWTKNAVYEIVSGGNVLATATLDQTTAKDGDRWHTIATNLALTAAGAPVLRVRNGSTAGALIADAVYITSATLYNDGTPAAQVTLAPMDGILLQRQQAVARVAVVNAANYQATFASEAIVAGFGQNLATASGAAPGLPLPTSLFGTTITVKDAAGVMRPAPLFFVSPGQVNYLIPAGTATGPATVTITSGAGAVSMTIIQIDTVAPGLFSANANGQGVAAAVALRVKTDGSQSFEAVARYDAAQNQFVSVPLDLGPSGDQVYLILFGTGWRGRSGLTAVTCKLGGLDAGVSFAGAQGDLVGLDQVNIGALPRNLAGRGEVDLVLTVDGKTANAVRVNLK